MSCGRWNICRHGAAASEDCAGNDQAKVTLTAHKDAESGMSHRLRLPKATGPLAVSEAIGRPQTLLRRQPDIGAV